MLKLHATILLILVGLSASPAGFARGGGGGGHGGGGGGGGRGGGGGGGYRGGGHVSGNYGGGVHLGYSGGGRGSNWVSGANSPRGGYGNGYGGYGGYGYGGYGGYGAGSVYDNGYSAGGYGNAAPEGDPLADYYRQQAAYSQAAQVETYGSTLPAQTYVQPSTTSLATAMQNATANTSVSVDFGNEIRDNFHGSGLFSPTWWKSYKNAWCNPSWPANWVWSSVDWSTLARFWGMSSGKPAGEYDFGQNVKYENGVVYFGDQPTVKAADFYLIAQNLAAKGALKPTKGVAPLPSTSDWQPFGVFSLVHASQKFSTTLFQLAINKQGLLRGNCYNILTGQLDTVNGAADKTNSRVAFTVGSNHSVIYDSGLGNLLSAQSSILVHMDKNDREQMTLVRLRQAKLQ